MLAPFILGAIPHVHWSNILVVLIPCLATGTIILIAISGWPTFTPSSLPLLPVISAVLAGILTTLYRLSVVFGCYELEHFGTGMAGFICNLVFSSAIPITALLSFALFGEVLGLIEIIGASMIFVAIASISVVKYKREAVEPQEEMESLLINS